MITDEIGTRSRGTGTHKFVACFIYKSVALCAEAVLTVARRVRTDCRAGGPGGVHAKRLGFVGVMAGIALDRLRIGYYTRCAHRGRYDCTVAGVSGYG